MALPKGGRKNNLKVYPSKTGQDRRNEINSNSDLNTIFTPYSITYQDLDEEVLNFFETGIGNTVLNGKPVPTFFITIQRWAEVEKTWKFTNGDDRTILRPFVLIKRSSTEKGTRMGDGYNVYAQQKKFTYVKVNKFDGNNSGGVVYKQPQPTNVDINYDIMLFTDRFTDLNTYDQNIHYIFSSRQAFINPYNNYMTMLLEGTTLDDTFSNIDKEKMFIQTYNVKLQGFIIDKENFEEIPLPRRTIITTEIE